MEEISPNSFTFFDFQPMNLRFFIQVAEPWFSIVLLKTSQRVVAPLLGMFLSFPLNAGSTRWEKTSPTGTVRMGVGFSIVFKTLTHLKVKSEICIASHCIQNKHEWAWQIFQSWGIAIAQLRNWSIVSGIHCDSWRSLPRGKPQLTKRSSPINKSCNGRKTGLTGGAIGAMISFFVNTQGITKWWSCVERLNVKRFWYGRTRTENDDQRSSSCLVRRQNTTINLNAAWSLIVYDDLLARWQHSQV